MTRWARRWLPEAVLGVQGEEDQSEVVDITPKPPALPGPEEPRKAGLEQAKDRMRESVPSPKAAEPEPTPPADPVPQEQPAREPGEDDEKPCAHQPLWRLAASAEPGRKLLCPDCDSQVSPREIKDARDAAQAARG